MNIAKISVLVVLGIAAPFLYLTLGRPALVVIALVIAWAALSKERAFRLAWLLIAAGATALVLIALAYQRCASALARGGDCALPDTTGYVAGAASLVVSGVVLLLTIRRPSLAP